MSDPRHAKLAALMEKAERIFQSRQSAADIVRPIYAKAFRLREQMRADGLTIAKEYDDA